jgi:hypothetical protein
VSAKIEIPEAARIELREHLVPEAAIDAGECMLGHAVEIAATVAREYDEAEGYDQNLAGFNVARRAKNVAATDLREQDLDEVFVRPRQGFTWDIRAGGTNMHFYSAPSGIDHFQLDGSERKAEIVDRSAQQQALFDASGVESQPGDLVLAYSRNEFGIAQACLGVIKSPTEFAWQVPIYGVDEGTKPVAVEDEPRDRGPSFREQPDEDADISLKDPAEKRENL